ncbi:MAG: ASCH domain-containing protein [Ornithinimicrobium sp.]|jgi:uncharacterized protein YhfF|uniref:ASCH domain-containing protein n=1 Tax=Ornithinimicrobium sp. TaxID=1977084 RepID=UPI003D9AD356
MEHDELEAFWVDARIRAKINRVSGYLGVSAKEVLRPPAWSFGGDPTQADELLSLVLAGTKTATSSARADYDADGEQVPEFGSLSIVLDGAGHPRALLRTTDVRVVRFDQVDAAHARAEGEADGSLEQWREAHAEFFEQQSHHRFDPEMLVVLENFEVLVAVPYTGEDALSPTSIG